MYDTVLRIESIVIHPFLLVLFTLGSISEDPFLAKFWIQAFVPRTKVLKMNNLDNFKPLFCFHTYDVRRSIGVLYPENQPRSGSIKIRTGSGA